MSYTSDLGEAIAAMRKRTISLAWLAALTGLLALTACDSATNSGMGTVRLYLASSGGAAMVSSLVQDPPAASLSNPRILVARVELIPGRQEIADFGEDGEWFSLTPSENDVSALLGTAEVPAGDYAQLRLILTEATVDVDGQATELIVPSGTQTGVKFDFPSPLHIEENGTTNLVVVFNIDESYVVTGNGRVLFKPVIHASVAPGAMISGHVTLATPPTPAPEIVIKAILDDDNDNVVVSSTTATPTADATDDPNLNEYSLRFLPAGAYIVELSASGYTPVTVLASVAEGEVKVLSPVTLNLAP